MKGASKKDFARINTYSVARHGPLGSMRVPDLDRIYCDTAFLELEDLRTFHRFLGEGS